MTGGRSSWTERAASRARAVNAAIPMEPAVPIWDVADFEVFFIGGNEPIRALVVVAQPLRESSAEPGLMVGDEYGRVDDRGPGIFSRNAAAFRSIGRADRSAAGHEAPLARRLRPAGQLPRGGGGGARAMILQTPAGRLGLTGHPSEATGLPLDRPNRSLPSTGQANPGPALDELARRLYAIRRDRRRFFDQSIFGEAAWDMLLLLYWAGARGRGLNAKILTRATGVPGSTARRWLAMLERQGLVVRRPAAGGHPSRTVMLTDAADASLTEYLSSLSSAFGLQAI